MTSFRISLILTFSLFFFSQQATWKFQLVLKWYIFVNSCKNIFHVCLWLNLGLHLVSWCSKKGWLKPLFPAVFWSLWILQAFSCTMAVYLLYLCLIPWCFSVSGVRRMQHPRFRQEADFDSSLTLGTKCSCAPFGAQHHFRCRSISEMPMQTWLAQQGLAASRSGTPSTTQEAPAPRGGPSLPLVKSSGPC